MTLSDSRVAELVNRHFVPCWETVGPVPRVTVDFGGGRTLTRTLGGNTLFSVCAPDGRVIDAYPGVYLPDDFLAEAGETLKLLEGTGGSPAPDDARVLAWHRERVGQAVTKELRTTLSKALVETPLLNALGVPRAQRFELMAKPETVLPPDPAAALEALSSRIVDVSKQPAPPGGLDRWVGVPAGATPEQRGAAGARRDSQVNVKLVRPAVHLLFATYGQLPVARRLRDDVYRRILHVPVDDPYLGLADALVPGTPPGR